MRWLWGLITGIIAAAIAVLTLGRRGNNDKRVKSERQYHHQVDASKERVEEAHQEVVDTVVDRGRSASGVDRLLNRFRRRSTVKGADRDPGSDH